MLGSESPYTCHTAQKNCPGRTITGDDLRLLTLLFLLQGHVSQWTQSQHDLGQATNSFVLWCFMQSLEDRTIPNGLQIFKSQELKNFTRDPASTRLDSSTFKLGFPNLPVVPARSMLLTEDMSIQPGQIGIFRRHLLHCDLFDDRTM